MHTEVLVIGEVYEDLSGEHQLVECAGVCMCLAIELTPNLGLA